MRAQAISDLPYVTYYVVINPYSSIKLCNSIKETLNAKEYRIMTTIRVKFGELSCRRIAFMHARNRFRKTSTSKAATICYIAGKLFTGPQGTVGRINYESPGFART